MIRIAEKIADEELKKYGIMFASAIFECESYDKDRSIMSPVEYYA